MLSSHQIQTYSLVGTILFVAVTAGMVRSLIAGLESSRASIVTAVLPTPSVVPSQTTDEHRADVGHLVIPSAMGGFVRSSTADFEIRDVSKQASRLQISQRVSSSVSNTNVRVYLRNNRTNQWDLVDDFILGKEYIIHVATVSQNVSDYVTERGVATIRLETHRNFWGQHELSLDYLKVTTL